MRNAGLVLLCLTLVLLPTVTACTAPAPMPQDLVVQEAGKTILRIDAGIAPYACSAPRAPVPFDGHLMVWDGYASDLDAHSTMRVPGQAAVVEGTVVSFEASSIWTWTGNGQPTVDDVVAGVAWQAIHGPYVTAQDDAANGGTFWIYDAVHHAWAAQGVAPAAWGLPSSARVQGAGRDWVAFGSSNATGDKTYWAIHLPDHSVAGPFVRAGWMSFDVSATEIRDGELHLANPTPQGPMAPRSTDEWIRLPDGASASGPPPAANFKDRTLGFEPHRFGARPAQSPWNPVGMDVLVAVLAIAGAVAVRLRRRL